MYSIANSSNTNVPILDIDNGTCPNDGVFNFDQNASKFYMIMFIVICVAVLYVVYLMKYDYDKGQFDIPG